MEKFVRLAAKACPLPVPNINTDQILPARFLKWPRSRGLGAVLFQDLRFDTDGKERPDFPLNKPAFRDAKISSQRGISAAARRAKRQSMLCTTSAFVV